MSDCDSSLFFFFPCLYFYFGFPSPPSDLNFLLPATDFEDFLSPLPEPLASGSAQLQQLSCIACEFLKCPSLLCHL